MQKLVFRMIIASLAGIGLEVGDQDRPDDSPQSVFKSFVDAEHEQDWSTLYATFSPGYRDYRLFECAFALGMDTSVDAKKLMDQYVDQEKLENRPVEDESQPDVYETHKRLSQSVEKKRDMFIDCMTYFKQQANMGTTKQPKFGDLRDLKMYPNVAMGKVSMTSNVVSHSRETSDAKSIRRGNRVTVEIPMYFMKLESGWRIATEQEWNAQKKTGGQVDGKRLFERLKLLEGQWRISQPGRNTEVSFERMANGSVLVEKWRMSPTRTSMTVYSLDGDRLLVTHYCPQGNVPRLVYAGSGKDGVHRFEFLDGLNLQDKNGSHQHSFWMRFNSDNSFTRSEIYIKNDETFDPSKHRGEPQTFDRVK